MVQHPSLAQLTFLLAITLGVAGLVVLIITLVHRSAREHREEIDAKGKPPRSDNEPAFVAATVQGVIAELKSREKLLMELCRQAEDRANFSRRALEAAAAQIPFALLLFDREGLLSLANPAARELMKIDVWSRRRYPQLLADSALITAIQDCLESAAPSPQKTIQFAMTQGGELLQATISAIEDSRGGVAGVVCLVRESKNVAPE